MIEGCKCGNPASDDPDDGEFRREFQDDVDGFLKFETIFICTECLIKEESENE